MFNTSGDKLKKLVTIIKEDKDKKAVDLTQPPKPVPQNGTNTPKK